MNRPFRVAQSPPLLDIVSYGRRGPGHTDRLSRTDRPYQPHRTPRTGSDGPGFGGGKSLKAVQAHVGYIGRRGRLDIESDDGGEPMRGRGAAIDLTEDWDLETQVAESKSLYDGIPGRKPVKLVHNIVLSMPKGTSPAECSQQAERSHESSLHRNIDTPWCCTRISPTPMCISWSKR